MGDMGDALGDLRDYFIKFCNGGLQLPMRDCPPEWGTVGRLRLVPFPKIPTLFRSIRKCRRYGRLNCQALEAHNPGNMGRRQKMLVTFA